MSRADRTLTCILAAIAFLGLLVTLEARSRTAVATAQIQASARVTIAKERTERSGNRLNAIRCVLRHPTCEEQP